MQTLEETADHRTELLWSQSEGMWGYGRGSKRRAWASLQGRGLQTCMGASGAVEGRVGCSGLQFWEITWLWLGALYPHK